VSGLHFSLAGLLLLASCGSPPPTAPKATPPDEELTLAPGQSGLAQGGRVRVVFQSVSADSRCPVDVTCVWEGDAVVVITAVIEGGEASRHELHTSGRYPSEAEVGGFRIRLAGLAPVPRSDRPPTAADYRATLLVTAR
jgi:hypothetical protein